MAKPLRFSLPIAPRCASSIEDAPRRACDVYASNILIANGSMTTHCRLHIEGAYNEAERQNNAARLPQWERDL